MSSIYGKINFNQQQVTTGELSIMESVLNHWDADDKGQWHNAHTGLGHLMIYDTPESLHEKLPLHNSISGLTIVADARIDNREELFAKLYADSVDKTQVPDSTLILKTYEKYGEDCVQHLIGDFAFAIWDEQKQKLFCARDHMGVKPFLYYHDEFFFAFASEKKGLLALNSLNKEINEDYLLKVMGNIAPDAEETLYIHIKKLTGAHTLIIQQGKININRYWDLDITKEIHYADPQQYIDRFLELFREAVRCRLRSAYPVGAELSGGLDSSGITAIAAELLHAEGREIYSISYGLTPEQAAAITIKTEEAFADEVIRFAKIDHPIKVCSSGYNHFLEEADLSLRINDGPNYQTIWHNPVKKAAGAHRIRVLLSGFPGDELVTNYSRMFVMEHAIKGEYKTFFKAARNKYGRIGALKLLGQTKGQRYFEILKPWLNQKEIKRRKGDERNFLPPGYFKRIEKFIAIAAWPQNFREVQKRFILAGHVSGRMEMEGRNSLLYKTESRFPMADIRLIEYVLALPFAEKASMQVNRFLYRRAMKGIIPDIVVNRRDKTTIMQPFILKELRTEQEEARAWMQHLKQEDKIPDYIDFDKLMQLSPDADNPIHRASGMQKKAMIILNWNAKKR
jgi:asparagine synthase (glutamine-hydrolysing)